MIYFFLYKLSDLVRIKNSKPLRKQNYLQVKKLADHFGFRYMNKEPDALLLTCLNIIF